MKKTILLASVALSVVLVSCNDSNKKSETVNADHTEAIDNNTTAASGHKHLLSNDWVQEIQLDNGNHWKANKETTEGVQEMLNILNTTPASSVAQYHELAQELNEEKNQIVRKCTMEGASHDNLHIFLHPLIEKINALGKVESAEEGAEITKSIKENLKAYYDYFQ